MARKSSAMYRTLNKRKMDTLTDQVAIVDVFMERWRPSKTDKALKITARKLLMLKLLQFQFQTHNNNKIHEQRKLGPVFIISFAMKYCNCLTHTHTLAGFEQIYFNMEPAFTLCDYQLSCRLLLLTSFYFIQSNRARAIQTECVLSLLGFTKELYCWRHSRKFLHTTTPFGISW